MVIHTGRWAGEKSDRVGNLVEFSYSSFGNLGKHRQDGLFDILSWRVCIAQASLFHEFTETIFQRGTSNRTRRNRMDRNSIEQVSSDKPTGHGNVDVRLQYGSDSDVRRGDGAVSSDSYPLTCDFEADTCTPLDISVVPRTLVVDTISFYEPQLEDYENEELTEEN
jgi:hypothetical protein